MKHSGPPRLFLRFFRWYCRPGLRNAIEGDLMELYHERKGALGKRGADRKFIIDVLMLCRPGIIRPAEGYQNLNHYSMFKSYFKIGWRNLLKNKGYSFINIGGLALGMIVTILIGLWMYDELTFDQYHANYDRLVQVMQHQTAGDVKRTGTVIPMPLENELRNKYGDDFEHISLFSHPGEHILSFKDQRISKTGNYVQPGFAEMVSLKMMHGTYDAFRDPASIFLSESAALALFGSTDVLNRAIQIDNKQDAKVTGVYKDLPYNTTFRDLKFFASWDLYMAAEWPTGPSTNWNDNFLMLYAQLAPHAALTAVSEKIKNIKADQLMDKSMKPEIFLNPMRDWYLRSEWKNGVNAGGRIQMVRMMGTTGAFVLLLACINFMNLSTARSENRSREVGIRMAIGSVRGQLISQFLSESFLVVLLSFIVAVLCAALLMPSFNTLTDKSISIAWTNPFFWSIGIAVVLLTSLVAGSYPALYLSSLRPIKVLRGTFKLGRFATLPRKFLVVFQFTISVLLAIGTIVVYKQIQFSKSRPIGYDRNGLITIQMKSPDFHGKLEALQTSLKNAGAIEEMAQASSPVTGIWNNSNTFQWQGKDPALNENFATIMITPDYGKTVGWTIAAGRDVSKEFAADSSAMILNEAAVKYTGVKDPIGMEISWGKRTFHVVGVVKDMIAGSPYDPIRPGIYMVNERRSEWMLLKLNPAKSPHESLAIIESAFGQVIPSAPFDYKFVDNEYARKFNTESRTGALALVFTVLAVAISCLGLFGLASFVAGQKVKEIGIRKVMGASVASLWQLLSKDFVILVVISCMIAIPLSVYIMSDWLAKYQYRTELSWHIFAAAGAGSMIITLVTVSFQSIKAAMANPVKSLRSE